MPASEGGNRRAFFDTRRWYTVECFPTRDAALDSARQHRRANSFGPGRAFRVVHGNTGWCVQHAGSLTANDRQHGAYYNRRMIEDDNKQRRLGF